MRIVRQRLFDQFIRFAEGGHGLVCGIPGIGKTHTMRRLGDYLRENGRISLEISIDNLGIENVKDLETALGLKSDLLRLMKEDSRVTKENPGFVLVDAFDAARSEVGQTQIISLLSRIINGENLHWHVIVSVRVFDARKSIRLQDLFPGRGDAPEFSSKDIRCRHFFIPPLLEDEITEAVTTIPGLDNVVEKASSGFRDLLKTPFNLWLMEQLLASPDQGDALSRVVSEAELLSLYWHRRVTSGQRADTKRMLLRKITLNMVEQHSLSAEVANVFDPDRESTWNDLLSSGVIEYAGDKQIRIAFNHNMLFDYAVNALLLDDDPVSLAAFLSVDIGRPLFLRPSLQYHFYELWHSDKGQFWDCYWRILHDDAVHIRLFATLLPPMIAAQQVKKADDIQQLIKYREKDRKKADKAIMRVLQALRVVQKEDEVSGKHFVWSVVFVGLSADCGEDFVGDMAICTEKILDGAIRDKNESIMSECGVVIRNIFEWIWSQRETETGLRFSRLASHLLLEMIGKTFNTNPAHSMDILSRVLGILKEPGYPIDFIYRLTDCIQYVWNYDPEFVAAVYIEVFSNPELSDDKTQMGTPVMPMTSNRRQDYRMCLYHLKNHFPAFVRAAPILAIRSALIVMNQRVIGEHIHPYLNDPDYLEKRTSTFSFREKQATFIADHSYIWLHNFDRADELQICSAMFDYLKEAAASGDNQGLVDQILDLFSEHARVALLWAELIRAGGELPEMLGIHLYDLCIADVILDHSETSHKVGVLLGVLYKHLTIEQRQQVEKVIMALTDIDDQEDLEYKTRRRNRLLGCLPVELLATPEASSLIEKLSIAKEIPENKPPVEYRMERKSFDTDDFLKEQGVDLEKPVNIQFKSYFQPLGKFTSDNSNKLPEAGSVADTIAVLDTAWKALHDAEGADEPIINYLWDKVAEAARTMAKGSNDPKSEEYTLAREILLECTVHWDPKPDPEYDAKYDSAGWSPAPRHEAAQGLPWLAVWNPDDRCVVEAIHKLADDPVPSVRFLVVSDAWRLIRHYPNDCWILLNKLASCEKNRVVKLALCQSIDHLVAKYPDESIEVLNKLFPDAGDVIDTEYIQTFVNIVMRLRISRNDPWAIQVSETYLKSPDKHSAALNQAMLDATDYVTPAMLEQEDRRDEMKRAKEWIHNSIDSSASSLKAIMAQPQVAISEEAAKKAHEVYSVIDEAVTRIYFASGFFSDSKEHKPVGTDLLKQYYKEVKPILEHVLDVTDRAAGGVMFAPTAHHFMQILNGFLDCDPPGVLCMTHRLTGISEAGGYIFDSMAVREITKLVERVLADHRVDIREPKTIEHLIGLLDIFTKAGWPEALNLIWRLDEIYR